MFADPEKNLKVFGLVDGEVVVDLGAGTGFYAILAANLNKNGNVYAVDVVKDYLETIKNKAKENGIKNLECVWGNIEKIGGTKLGDQIADKVIASNVLFQVEDKDSFLEEMKRILKKGGEVMLIDWADGESPIGPSVTHCVTKEKALSLMQKKGFSLKKEIDAGEHHYGMILRKI